MTKLNKKSAIVEICSQAALKKDFNSEVDKADYKDSIDHIKELASNPNPNNRYELNQIVAYTVDNVIDVRLNYLPLVAEVRNTDYQERPKFKIKTQGITAFWQAIGSTTERTKVGYKYGTLELEELSARPTAEWAEVASGRYDFAELIRDVTNEFEAKIAQKLQETLYATFSALESPNYSTGSGIVSANFDPLLIGMQRFANCAIICDFAAATKFASATGFITADSTVQFSPNIIDEQIRNGFIGTYKGAPVIKLDNPYAGLTGFDTVLDAGYIYIVPAVSDQMKTVKVHFAGGTRAMEGTNIDDGSYEQRFDRLMGCGVLDARHPLAVYVDGSL